MCTYVLLSDLSLFLWREVVLDIEELSNLFRSLALDHVCAEGRECGVESIMIVRIRVCTL